MADEESHDLTLDDLEKANVDWSEKFQRSMKEKLQETGFDSGKRISLGNRRVRTAAHSFNYKSRDEYDHEKMRLHASDCVYKLLNVAGGSDEIHVKQVFLVHTKDGEQCVVFVNFEYEFQLNTANIRPIGPLYNGRDLRLRSAMLGHGCIECRGLAETFPSILTEKYDSWLPNTIKQQDSAKQRKQKRKKRGKKK